MNINITTGPVRPDDAFQYPLTEPDKRATSRATIRAAYISHFTSYSWSHYCHLTFRHPQSTQSAAKAVQRMVRNLERRVQHKVDLFGAVEVGSLTNRVHCHCVLSGCESLTYHDFQLLWMNHGFIDIERYDPEQYGLVYATKTLAEPSAALLLSRRKKA